jgi:hypothetical protein
MNISIFFDTLPYSPLKVNHQFGGTYASIFKVESKPSERLDVRMLPASCSFLAWLTSRPRSLRNISSKRRLIFTRLQGDGTLHSHCCENLQSNGSDSYSLFKILSVIARSSVNLNIRAPKLGALQMVHPVKIDFLENDFKETRQISVIYRDNPRKQNFTCGIFRKIMVCSFRAQKQIADFVETGYTGQTDLTVAWYPSTNNDLPNNNLFIFQYKVTYQPYIRKSVQCLCIKLYIFQDSF